MRGHMSAWDHNSSVNVQNSRTAQHVTMREQCDPCAGSVGTKVNLTLYSFSYDSIFL